MTRVSPTPLTLLFFAAFNAATWGAPLSWNDLAAEALKSNPDIRAAEEGVKSAKAQVKASYSGFFPQLSASAGYSRSVNNVELIGSTPNDQYTAALSASQSLFAGFKDLGKLDSASASEDIATLALQIALAKVHYDLKSAYASLLFAREQVRLTAKITQRREDNLKLVSLRYEGGRENKGSFLLSRASLAQARFERDQARRAEAVARQQLNRVLGRAEVDEIDVTGELITGEPEASPDFENLAKQTPEHHQAEAQTRSAEADWKVARAAWFPEVSLTGSIGRFGNSFFPASDRWSYGMSITFPFFPGGQNIFLVEAASAQRNRASWSQSSIDQQLLVKLRQSHAAFLDATGNREVAQEFFKAASERATISRGKYTTGLMTFEDWDLIETDLITREKAALAAKKDAVIAEVAWLQVLGRGLKP